MTTAKGIDISVDVDISPHTSPDTSGVVIRLGSGTAIVPYEEFVKAANSLPGVTATYNPPTLLDQIGKLPVGAEFDIEFTGGRATGPRPGPIRRFRTTPGWVSLNEGSAYNHYFHQGAANTDFGNAVGRVVQDVWDEARSEGWVTRGSNHCCPDHA